jgi:hypothetical protein
MPPGSKDQCTFPNLDGEPAAGRYGTRQELIEGKSAAEIDSPDLGVTGEHLGRTSPEDAPFIDNVGAIGDRESLSHIMVGD